MGTFFFSPKEVSSQKPRRQEKNAFSRALKYPGSLTGCSAENALSSSAGVLSGRRQPPWFSLCVCVCVCVLCVCVLCVCVCMFCTCLCVFHFAGSHMSGDGLHVSTSIILDKKSPYSGNDVH